MSDTPKVSILFATHNGAKRLRRTMDSLVAQDFPRQNWELIIVDNASTDDTSAILSSYGDQLPLTLVHHAEPGKSKALNAAMHLLQGELIVLTDDDIRAEPDWLSAFVKCADTNPDYGIFGGRIIPEWEKEPGKARFLDWIPMGPTFAILDETDNGPCTPERIWGPNTAVRRSVLKPETTRFREDIGPAPLPIYAMGQDTEMIVRLAKTGAKAYRCGAAAIHHWIPASNVTEIWVQKRGERLGYGIPALFPERVPGGPRIGGVPVKVWIESLYWNLRAAALYPFTNSKLRFWAIWKYYYMRGLRAGIRRFAA